MAQADVRYTGIACPTLAIMALANGPLTSNALRTCIPGRRQAFLTAIGQSFAGLSLISMIAMESVRKPAHVALTGDAVLT